MSNRKSSIFYGLLIALVSVVGGMILASRLDLAPGSFASAFTIPARNSAPLSGPVDATTFRMIAKEASPSVVTVKVVTSRPAGGDADDMFGFQLPFPFGNRPGQGPQTGPPRMQEMPALGEGSGFIIDKAGFILTNNHVIDNAKQIDIFLSNMTDQEGLSAKVVGRDELSDTALLQLTEFPREPLQAAKFGDSDQMAPGDWVVAIGNPFGYENSVTVGVVSAVGRHNPVSNGRSQDFIQTDAAINRGNSGGPLLNVRGEVIGMNTMIVSTRESGGNMGLGFAIPVNTISYLLPQLQSGKVTRGKIGVRLEPDMRRDEGEDFGLAAGTTGVVVRSVENGSPAQNAGIAAGDVIFEFNGKAVKNTDELVNAVTRTAPGTTVPLKVMRNRKAVTLNVRVEELDLEAERAPLASRRNAPGAPPAAPTDTGFGMHVQPVQPSELRALRVPNGRGGAIVTDVTPLGPAFQAGLSEGDVILTVQGQEVRSVEEVTKALSAVAAGRTARLVVWHSENGQPGQETLVQIRKR